MPNSPTSRPQNRPRKTPRKPATSPAPLTQSQPGSGSAPNHLSTLVTKTSGSSVPHIIRPGSQTTSQPAPQPQQSTALKRPSGFDYSEIDARQAKKQTTPSAPTTRTKPSSLIATAKRPKAQVSSPPSPNCSPIPWTPYVDPDAVGTPVDYLPSPKLPNTRVYSNPWAARRDMVSVAPTQHPQHQTDNPQSDSEYVDPQHLTHQTSNNHEWRNPSQVVGHPLHLQHHGPTSSIHDAPSQHYAYKARLSKEAGMEQAQQIARSRAGSSDAETLDHRITEHFYPPLLDGSLSRIGTPYISDEEGLGASEAAMGQLLRVPIMLDDELELVNPSALSKDSSAHQKSSGRSKTFDSHSREASTKRASPAPSASRSVRKSPASGTSRPSSRSRASDTSRSARTSPAPSTSRWKEKFEPSKFVWY